MNLHNEVVLHFGILFKTKTRMHDISYNLAQSTPIHSKMLKRQYKITLRLTV